MEQYGVLALVNTTMFLAVAVAKMGLSDGIIRFYKEYRNTPEQRTIFSSTVIVRGILISSLAVLFFVVIISRINRHLTIANQYLSCFMIMALYLLINPLNTIAFNLLRVNGKTLLMNVIILIGRIASFGLSLYFLIYVFHGLYGYFIGVVLAEYFVSLILLYWVLSNYKISLAKVSGALALKLIKFGAPLLFTELSYLLLSYADRYMIVAYHGESMLGLYSVGYNLATYLSNIITFSLSYAIIPIYVELYENEGKKKTEDFLEKCIHYLLIAAIPVCVGYFVISEDLFTTLATQKYTAAATFSPLILLGSLLLGINSILNAGLYLKKKSMTILYIMLVALIINIIMNLILLPKYGVIGAAVATLVACGAATALTVSLSFKYIAVRVNVKTVSYYLMLSGLMFLVVKQIAIPTSWMNLIAKMIIGVIIIVPGVLFREKEILIWIKGIRTFNNV